MFNKISLVLSVFIIIVFNHAFAHGNDLFRDNAISFKVGYHLYPKSDFMDAWAGNASDFNGFAFEVNYDKNILKNLSVGCALGFFPKGMKYESAFLFGDTPDIDIKNIYFNLSAKYHLKLTKSLECYLGIAPHFYHTSIDCAYKFGSFESKVSDKHKTFGIHGLVGVEYVFCRNPTKQGLFDIPTGIFIEYTYSSVKINNVDEKLINDINNEYSLALPFHDLDIGGHLIFSGIRWHF